MLKSSFEVGCRASKKGDSCEDAKPAKSGEQGGIYLCALASWRDNAPHQSGSQASARISPSRRFSPVQLSPPSVLR